MMRCLTIAKELVRRGDSVTFFLADEESKGLFDAYVGTGAEGGEIGAVVLGTNWQDMEAEIPALVKELSAGNVVSILVDSYSVTPAYFRELGRICPVAYIDDLNADTYPVDLLINYSGYYASLGYKDAYKNVCGHNGVPTKLLLGLKYAPLREQFYKAEEENQPQAEKVADGHEERNSGVVKHNKNVLLTSGGADTRGMLLATLRAAEEAGLIPPKENTSLNMVEMITWHVVVGSLVRDDGAITEFAEMHPSVQIHRSVTDMAGLMRSCDIAICAAGTMLTECAATGLPAIFYQVADNQKYNVEFWSSTGGMTFAGDATEDANEVIEKTCRELTALLPDSKRMIEMKKSLSGLTDGRGAERIAKAILG